MSIGPILNASHISTPCISITFVQNKYQHTLPFVADKTKMQRASENYPR